MHGAPSTIASWAASRAAACGTTGPAMRCSKEKSRWRKTAASHRCGQAPESADKSGATACLIEARGDTKQFKLSLLTDDGFDSVNYQASFAPDTAAGRRSACRSSFRASFRGRDVPGAPALDPARIRQVGLMITGRQAGPFALDIRRIGLA
jgi:hypothetical protein